MSNNILILLDPSNEEKRTIEGLTGYLIRNGFKELYLPDIRKDMELSDNDKVLFETWFNSDQDHVILGHLIFMRRGNRWYYEIHSVESPLIMAEEVLFWIKEEFSLETPLNVSDRIFLSLVLDIYQELMDDRLLKEAGCSRKELKDLRIIPTEDFFEFIEKRLWRDGYPYLTVHRNDLLRLIEYFKEYELLRAVEW